MSDLERMIEHLGELTVLVVDHEAGTVERISWAEVERRAKAETEPRWLTIQHLARALKAFAERFGTSDRTFTLKEIADMTGTPYHKAYTWLDDGLIDASVRPARGGSRHHGPLFSYADTFRAKVLFGLRQGRAGMPLELIQKAALQFVLKKRTSQKVVTSGRP